MTDIKTLRDLLERVGVRVKPLVWEEAEVGHLRAATVVGTYVIAPFRGYLAGNFGLAFDNEQETIGFMPTDMLEQSQACAQKDHDARILSALLAQEEKKEGVG